MSTEIKTTKESSYTTTISFFDVILITVCLILILIYSHPFVSNSLVAGIDLPGHLYLHQLMGKYLLQARISGFDPNWYTGYPAFTLYSPLPYIVSNLFFLFPGTSISSVLSFNLTLFFIPFFLLLAAIWSVRRWFGPESTSIAAVAVTLFFFYPANQGYVGLGLTGLYEIGYFGNYIGLIFFLFLIGCLAPRKDQTLCRSVPLGAIMLSCIILSHIHLAVFSFFLIFIQIGFFKRQRAVIGLSQIGFALLLTSFWWLPFTQHLWLSSGRSRGLLDLFSDPLFAILPDINRDAIANLLTKASYHFNQNKSFQNPLAFVSAIVQLIGELPYIAIIYGGFGIWGLYSLLRDKNYFFPSTFVLSFLLLPRNLLPDLVPWNLHYFRFIQPISILLLFCVCFGMLECKRSIQGISAIHIRRIFKITGTCAAAYAVTFSAWKGGYIQPISTRILENRAFFLEQYRGYQQALTLGDMLSKMSRDGRVAEEAATGNRLYAGTPRLFSTLLPLKYGIPVLGGLLAESAVNAGVINSALNKSSTNFQSGRSDPWNNPEFSSQSLGSMLDRLGLFNTQFLISSSPSYTLALLKEAGRVTPIAHSGPYWLFRLSQYRPMIEPVKSAPFFFEDRGGISFRQFNDAWFTEPRLFSTPVIYHPAGFKSLPLWEQKKIPGLIISCDYRRRLRLSDLRQLKKLNKPIIILGSRRIIPRRLKSPIVFIPGYLTRSKMRFMSSFLAQRVGYSQNSKQLNTRVISDTSKPDQVKFENDSLGTIINFAYAPKWQSTEVTQTVFMVTPGLMFTFTKRLKKQELLYVN